MKNQIKRMILPGILCISILLSGCTGGAAVSSGDRTASNTPANSNTPAQALDVNGLFSDRDNTQTYDETAAVTILLTGDTAQCASDAVSISGGRITLLDEGVYVFSGTLTEGQIVVNGDSGDKVQIVLNGADITSAASAALYCLEADKVFLTLAEGTENALSNGGSFETIDDNNIDGAIFSKTDLTLNGCGSLTVNSPVGHGIVSKDELTITGGSYTVTAAKHGLTGKDGVAISGGSFTITSGKDGIHAENADDTEKAFLYLAGGSFAINAQGDALSAGGALQIDGGSYVLTTGGGSAEADMKAGDGAGGPGGFWGGQNQTSTGTASQESAESCKGLKAGGALTVNGGRFELDTADDAVHGGGDVTITGGQWSIRTGDDGIHADGALVIEAGDFSIPYCYEGLEGQSVSINGGTFDIISCDDGINAAGGTDGSGANFGFGRPDRFAADENCFVIINGGTITIVSDGDSIDSNGNLTVNGGTLKLTCNGNGNTALDSSGTLTHNGGDITTNDGSESGGGMGFPGGGKEPGGGKRPDDGRAPSGMPPRQTPEPEGNA